MVSDPGVAVTYVRPWAPATAAMLADWPALAEPLVAALSEGRPTDDAVSALADTLAERMGEVARESARLTAADAAAQDADNSGGEPSEARIAKLAATFAGVIASGYGSVALQATLGLPLTEAGRLKAAASAVRDAVRAALTALGTAVSGLVPTQVGAAMAAAEHEGAVSVFEAHPPRYLVATELHQVDRCAPCADVNGKRYNTLAEALEDYPQIGYLHCRGGSTRCRGHLSGVWSEDPEPLTESAVAPLDADATPHTGAMIALVPSAEDAARLAVDGGEPADELHCTIAYLGDADQLDTSARQQLIAATTAAVQGMPIIDANAFGLASFGQAGDEPCNVLNVGGDMLDAAHHFLNEFIPFEAPDQHAPWNAHVTLEYTDDLGRLKQFVDRLGPIRFDRVRLAIAGETVDIPLLDDDFDDEADDGFEAWLTGQELSEAGVKPGRGEQLKRYWLAGPGLQKWTGPDVAHPWTTLYRHLRKFIKNIDKLKRTTSAWYRDHYGHMPNQHLAERYDPTQHRANDGKWTRVVAAANLKVGKQNLRLTHHGDGNVSVHDEHGGSLRVTRDELGRGIRSGGLRNFAYSTPVKSEHVGDHGFLSQIETRDGKPWTTAAAGLTKTHVADEHTPGLHDPDEPYLNDRHILHLPVGGKPVDDPADLYARPGTSMTTKELATFADALRAFADGHDDVDTGHGRITMGVTGKDFTFDTGKRGERPIVLNRGELRSVGKALDAAYSAHDPGGGVALSADQPFTRTIPTKNSGDIVVTRPGAGSDFWVESDFTAVRIKPAAFHDVDYHIDAMLALSGEVKHLEPVAVRPVAEAATPDLVPRPLSLSEVTFSGLGPAA